MSGLHQPKLPFPKKAALARAGPGPTTAANRSAAVHVVRVKRLEVHTNPKVAEYESEARERSCVDAQLEMLAASKSALPQMQLINHLGGKTGYLDAIWSIKDWPVGRRLIAILLATGKLHQDTVTEEGGHHPFDSANPGHYLQDRVGVYVHVTTLRNLVTGEEITVFYVGSAQAALLDPSADIAMSTVLALLTWQPAIPQQKGFLKRMRTYIALDKAWVASGDVDKFLKKRQGCRQHGKRQWPARTRQQRDAAANNEHRGMYDDDEWKVLSNTWFVAMSMDPLEHFTVLARNDRVFASKLLPYWMQFRDRDEFRGVPPASTALNHLLEGFVMLKMGRCNTSMTKEGKVYALPHHDAIRAKRNDVWVPDPEGITLSTSNLRFTAFEKDHDHVSSDAGSYLARARVPLRFPKTVNELHALVARGFHPLPGTERDTEARGQLGLTRMPIRQAECDWATKQLTEVFKFDGEGCSALNRIVKKKSGKRVLSNFKSTGYLRDSLKQFKRYVLPISDSDAPSYNKGDGDEEAHCDLIIDGHSAATHWNVRLLRLDAYGLPLGTGTALVIYLYDSSGTLVHEITREFGQNSTGPDFTLLTRLACVLRTSMAISKVSKQTGLLQGAFFTQPQAINDDIESELLVQALNPSGFEEIPRDEAKFEEGTRLVKIHTDGLAPPQHKDWADPLMRPTTTFIRCPTSDVPPEVSVPDLFHDVEVGYLCLPRLPPRSCLEQFDHAYAYQQSLIFLGVYEFGGRYVTPVSKTSWEEGFRLPALLPCGLRLLRYCTSDSADFWTIFMDERIVMPEEVEMLLDHLKQLVERFRNANKRAQVSYGSRSARRSLVGWAMEQPEGAVEVRFGDEVYSERVLFVQYSDEVVAAMLPAPNLLSLPSSFHPMGDFRTTTLANYGSIEERIARMKSTRAEYHQKSSAYLLESLQSQASRVINLCSADWIHRWTVLMQLCRAQLAVAPVVQTISQLATSPLPIVNDLVCALLASVKTRGNLTYDEESLACSMGTLQRKTAWSAQQKLGWAAYNLAKHPVLWEAWKLVDQPHYVVFQRDEVDLAGLKLQPEMIQHIDVRPGLPNQHALIVWVWRQSSPETEPEPTPLGRWDIETLPGFVERLRAWIPDVRINLDPLPRQPKGEAELIEQMLAALNLRPSDASDSSMQEGVIEDQWDQASVIETEPVPSSLTAMQSLLQGSAFASTPESSPNPRQRKQRRTTVVRSPSTSPTPGRGNRGSLLLARKDEDQQDEDDDEDEDDDMHVVTPVRRLKLFAASSSDDTDKDNPPAGSGSDVTDEDKLPAIAPDSVYEAGEIKNSRYSSARGQLVLQYFVHWKGWTREHDTWETYDDDFNADDLIEAYEESLSPSSEAPTRAKFQACLLMEDPLLVLEEDKDMIIVQPAVAKTPPDTRRRRRVSSDSASPKRTRPRIASASPSFSEEDSWRPDQAASTQALADASMSRSKRSKTASKRKRTYATPHNT